MRFSKYILFLVLFFNIHSGFSQVVTVTSKEDSGPGTLRAALSNIPSNNTGYIINFNLPGDGSDYTNRTIRLRSQLPVVPSNVIIDGSSQSNWSALGVSGAKIIIEPELTNTSFNGLVIGQYYSDNTITSSVEIYGLYLRNFARIPNLQSVSGGSGIVVDYRANNIKIGASGKGNVIGGNVNGIVIQNSNYYSATTLNNISIQSNLIGVIYDGLTANSNVTGISANLYDCSITIGGDNAGDGNVISANQTNINVSRNSYSNASNRFEVNIINNKIGTDYAGKKDFHELPLFLSSSSLEISGVKVNSVNTQLYMRKNIISGNRTWGISITNADFILTGNYIGTGVSGTEMLGNGSGIKIELNATGTIGGATSDETNFIGYNNYGIESVSTKPVKITRNSMFCNKFISIGKALNNYQPYVQVLKKRSDYISGRATANSEIELFYTQNCEGQCEGRTYFKTVQAGSDGRWEYSGTMSGSVTASASLLNATTSQFSSAALLDNEAIIEPVTCNGNGSITIPEPREGFTFTWNKIINNGGRVFLNNGQQATNLDVGDYEVIIDDGCKAIARQFVITDQKLTDIIPVTPTPSCGQKTFSFGASVLRGKGTVRFQWKDANGVVVANTSGNTSSVTLPEGTYTVTATDDAGCTKPYTFAPIKRKPSPIITITKPTTAAACGKQNGSITGVKVDDATNPKFNWYTYDPATSTRGTTSISQDQDLVNVYGGYYVLVVSDDGGCPPVSTSPISIAINESVNITLPLSTKPATCGGDNGSATGITIVEADTYELFSPTGVSLKKAAYAPGDVLTFSALAPGRYRIHALNSVTGCADDDYFIINKIEPTVYTFTPTPLPTTCGDINGSITIRFGNNTPLPTTYTWTDAVGNTIKGGIFTNSTTLLLPNLPGGTYSMTAYDVNGCPVVFGPYRIEETEVLSINNSPVPPVNDGCSLSRGAIMGLTGRGGILPYTYIWYNEAGEKIASQTTPDLIGVPAGKYHMILKDATPCGEARSNEYTVENPSFPIATPVANSLRVCYAMEIMIKVVAPEEGTYQLYKDITDATPIMENSTGVFVFKVSKTGDYHIRKKLGTCYSDFTTSRIEVTNDNLQVMNTITPNGDGLNDTWVINGLPESGDINIKLYSRSGQLVYESAGKYNKPFDGRFRGKELPAGVYYYRIDLRADCNPLGGSLTLLR